MTLDGAPVNNLLADGQRDRILHQDGHDRISVLVRVLAQVSLFHVGNLLRSADGPRHSLPLHELLVVLEIELGHNLVRFNPVVWTVRAPIGCNSLDEGLLVP